MNCLRYVYALRNNDTQKVYVGSTYEPYNRIQQHFRALINGSHKVLAMQEDHSDATVYECFILDLIPTLHDKEREYEWMLRLDSYKGYNAKDWTSHRPSANEYFSKRSTFKINDGMQFYKGTASDYKGKELDYGRCIHLSEFIKVCLPMGEDPDENHNENEI